MINRRRDGGARLGGPGDKANSGPFPPWVIDWSRRYSGATVFGPVWADYAAARLSPLLGRPRSAAIKDAALRYTPHAVLRLDDDPTFIGAAAQKLQNADLILVGLSTRGDLVLQAADFKARLIFADPKQVSAESLRALLTVVDARVGDALADVLAGPAFAGWKGPRRRGGALLDALLNAEGRGVALADGAFVVPESAADRAVLTARAWPNGHLRVIWVPPVAHDLVYDLPGAALLAPLAALDGVRDPYLSYDMALTYYEESCAALALLMELNAVPGVKHAGFDREGAAAALAVWVDRGTGGAQSSGGLASVRALAPMAPEAEAHRRLRTELEELLKLPLRLRTLAETLAREGTPIVFREPGDAAAPEGAVNVEAAREMMRAVADAYRAEMGRLLADLGPSITAADPPRMVKRAEALRAAAQEQATAQLRALAALATATPALTPAALD